VAGDYAVFAEGLDELVDLKEIKASIRRAALQAINKTADRIRTRAASEIRKQVNFPASYLNPSAGRLTVSQRATGDHLEARIRARTRATSLARFSAGSVGRAGGVRVEVAPGRSKFMRRAFLIRLRAGNADLDTRSNLGLAIRLRPGESLTNKTKAIKMQKNLYLLYGPSVDQVFLASDEKHGVAIDLAPEAVDLMEREFMRLVDL
jgi:hypothetical protein